MEQAIPVVSGGNAENKTFNPADLLKMLGAIGGKGNGKKAELGQDENSVSDLIPFLQFLNQQMALLFQTGDSSATSSKDKDGKEITLDQASLFFPVNITLQGLQQVLANLETITDSDQEDGVQSGVAGNALLEEIDLLKKNLAGGDAAKVNLLHKSVLDKNMVGSEGDDFLNKELAAISANNQSETNAEDISSEQIGQPVSSDNQKKGTILPGLLSGVQKQTENKEITFAFPAAENVTDISKNEIKDNNMEFEPDGKEKLSVLNNDEKAIASLKTAPKYSQTQVTENSINKVVLNFSTVKEESKNSRNLPGDKSERAADNSISSHVKISPDQIKESFTNKDNLAQEKYHRAAANSTAENGESAGTMQAILGDIADKSKSEQKGKTVSLERGPAEVSPNSINTGGNGPVKAENVNDVSPSQIINQIRDGIKENAPADGGRIKITLNPPSLGTVEMDVIVRNNRVDVVLTADNKDVQQTLNNHIDKLKSSLQIQGMTVERCEVMMQDRREEYHQSFSQHAFYHQGSGHGNNSRQENQETNFKPSTGIQDRQFNIVAPSADNISLFA